MTSMAGSDKELLVVSFGTSFGNSRERTIGAIEKALAAAFPEYMVCRAFTSQMIINKLKERDGIETDNVPGAMQRAAGAGVKELVIVPTHLMDGFEYHKLLGYIEEHKANFSRVSTGRPLLSSDDDLTETAKAIAQAAGGYLDGETAFCYMGHGTGAASNAVYEKLAGRLRLLGYRDIYIGTVEAAPTLYDLLAQVQAGSYRRVALRPLMIVAGDHASNDMAGDDPDSWKSTFAAAGYNVECILSGLGELPAVQQLFIAHARDAMQPTL